MRITAQQYLSNDKDRNTYVSAFRYYNKKSKKKVDKDGDLYSIIHLSGTQDIPAERVTKFVWDGIVDGYLYSNSSSANDSLKDAITEGVRKLRDLIRNDVDLEESGVNISFTVVVQRKEGIYIANFGENDIYVYRENKLTDIVEVLKKSKAQTAGLALKEGEILMVSTPMLLNDGISNFVGLRNIKEFKMTIKNFSNNMIDSEGLLILEMGEGKQDVVVEKKIEMESNEKEKERVLIPRVEKITGVEKKKVRKDSVLKKLNLGSKLEKVHVPEWMKRFEDIHMPKWVKKAYGYILPVCKRVLEFFKKIFRKIWLLMNEWLGKKRWFKKYAARFSQRIPRKKVSPRGMRIDGYKERDLRGKRFKLVFVGVLVLVVAALGVNFTMKTKVANEIHAEAEAIFVKSDDLISKAESKVVTDKNSAETYLYEVGKELKNIPEGMVEEDVERYEEIEEKVLELEDVLYKRVGIDDKAGSLMTFVDSRLSFGEGSNPTDIEIYTDDSANEFLLVTDSVASAVYRVSLYDKEVKKLPDNEGLVDSPLYLSIGNSGVFIYDDKMGVLKAAFEDGWFSSFNSLSGLDGSDIKSDDVKEFIVLTASDNVYLLARDKAALLKSGFSYGNSYNLTYTYIDNALFANAEDVLADLSVYVLSGGIVRYNYSYVEQKQVEAPLSVAGFSGDLDSLSKGYTRGSLDYGLYLFDSSDSRFFKFEKPKEGGGEILHPDQILLEGEYVYRGSKSGVWKDVKDFVVDTSEKFMYVLDGSTVWKVQL